MKNISYYFKVWVLMSRNSFLSYLKNGKTVSLFLLGKIIRFILFFGFIYYLIKNTNGLAGYSFNQVIFVFLTFNLVDIVSQFLFREVYRFRPLLITGDFDIHLIKPISPLFRVLLGGADVLDFITIPALFVAIVIFASIFQPSILQILLYVFLLINAFIIAASFHILILAFGIVSMEVDNAIMIYRDIVSLGRFPVDIYPGILRGILSYLIPVGLMITVPSKAIMGLLTTSGVLLSFIIGVVFIFVALKCWNFALTRYSSAST